MSFPKVEDFTLRVLKDVLVEFVAFLKFSYRECYINFIWDSCSDEVLVYAETYFAHQDKLLMLNSLRSLFQSQQHKGTSYVQHELF